MPVLETSPVRLYHGDCREILPRLSVNSVDAVVTDPPYELGFMGKGWDKTGIAFDPMTWGDVRRTLKPGGYMLAMGGSRTYHRLTCAIEDAGFEIRDCLLWLYGTGFPKGQGNLKPAYEPIVLARKPGKGVKPLGIDECRISTSETYHYTRKGGSPIHGGGMNCEASAESHPAGRYPANVVHDGSDEVMEAFAAFGDKGGGFGVQGKNTFGLINDDGWKPKTEGRVVGHGDTGTAARFFYCAKASKREREGSTHPTVKPLALMEWLIKLIAHPGEVVLDPFMGSGTTGKACKALGRRFIGIEKEEEHFQTARKRIQEQG